MASYPIKYFTNTMAGVPQLTNTWGCLTTMLDAVLVNGFNTLSVTSITRTGSVATVTFGSAHGFLPAQVIEITGCDQPEYSGEQSVIDVPTSTTLTFTVSGSPVTPGTGTINCKTPGLGWSIVFTGTDKRVYQAPTGNRRMLRVDNSLAAGWTASYAKFGKVAVSDYFLDIDTPSNNYYSPYDGTSIKTSVASNQVLSGSGVTAINGWYKWYYARGDGSAATEISAIGEFNRSWTVVGDNRGFYFLTELNNAGNGKTGYCFTDFISYKTGDTANTVYSAFPIQAQANQNISWAVGADYSTYFNRSTDGSGKLLYQGTNGTGPNTQFTFFTLNTNSSTVVPGTSTGITYPNGPDNSAILFPVWICQTSNADVRGVMPGMLWLLNANSPYTNNEIITVDGKRMLVVSMGFGGNGAVSRIVFDLTGTTNSWYV
jgi:hypothetical protein